MPPRRGLRSGGPPPVIPPVQPNVPVSQPQAPIEEQQQQEAPIVAAPAVAVAAPIVNVHPEHVVNPIAGLNQVIFKFCKFTFMHS